MMRTYDEAKKMVLDLQKKACGVDFRVLAAWELPDSFVFCSVGQDEPPLMDRASYDQVIKDELHPDFDFSPDDLGDYFDPEDKREIDALLAQARRIV